MPFLRVGLLHLRLHLAFSVGLLAIETHLPDAVSTLFPGTSARQSANEHKHERTRRRIARTRQRDLRREGSGGGVETQLKLHRGHSVTET